MSFAFIAIALSKKSEVGVRDRVEVLAARRGLTKIFTSSRLLVFATPNYESNLLDDAVGVLIGDVYCRHVPARAFDGRPENATRVSSAQRDGRLSAEYWGSYIALTTSPDGSCRVERSPFGTINAYYTVEAGTLMIASDASAVIEIANRSRVVDWDSVIRHIIWDNLSTLSTCLTGISEVRSGEAIASDGQSEISPECVWDPWMFTRGDAMIEDAETAVELVRREILRCVAARMISNVSYAVDLSGGLDSSIIAAAAAKSACALRSTTMFSAGNDGDERNFARAVADHLRIVLDEGAPDPMGPDLLRAARAHLARPHSRSFVQETDRISLELATKQGVGTFLNGQGGDAVFCHLQSSGPAADVIRYHGRTPRFAYMAFQVARAAQCSAWDIAVKGMKKALKGKKHDDWHSDVTFLASEARSVKLNGGLPWPAPSERALPGKVEHVHALYNSIYNMNGYARSDILKGEFPLLSQPLVECCLRIPTWLWIGRGRNRLIARRAMERDLPRKIAWRISKGGLGQFQLRMMRARRPLIREMLMDGRLSEVGILNRAEIESQLSDDMSFRSNDVGRILRLCDVEAWCRG